MEDDRIQLEQARLTNIKQDEDNRLAAETESTKIKLEIARIEAMSYNPNQNVPVLGSTPIFHFGDAVNTLSHWDKSVDIDVYLQAFERSPLTSG